MKKTIISMALLAITGFVSAQQKSVTSKVAANSIDKTAVALAPKQNQEQENGNAKMEEYMKKIQEESQKAEEAMTPEQKKQRDEDRVKSNAKMEEMMKKMQEDNLKAETAMTPEQKKQRDENNVKAMAKMEDNMKKMQNPSAIANPVMP